MRGRRWVPPSISGTPQRRSGIAERRALGGDPQVAPQRQLQAARQAEAGDRGDRRLGRRQAREAHRALRAHQPLAQGVGGLQVGARAEGHAAGAREHHHARILVGLEAQVGLVQGRRGGAVDGVAPVLAVDRDERRGARALVADGAGLRRSLIARPPLAHAAARAYQPPRHWASPRRLLRRLARFLAFLQAGAGACSSGTRTAGRR